jgi:KUP system potassium uptake protein
VLSAVEGLEVAAPALHRWVVPVTLVVLTLLFAAQRFGTAVVGRCSGPSRCCGSRCWRCWAWCTSRSTRRCWWRCRRTMRWASCWQHPGTAFVALGAVVLCVTGAEALYADLGHFGKRPIRLAWFAVVMPALVLNYFGQGAMLLQHPENVRNPFYEMAPTGRCSRSSAGHAGHGDRLAGAHHGGLLGHQAGHAAGLPAALRMLHTSVRDTGQIYVPFVNWALYGCVVFAVVVFGSSSALASAYGIAVTIDMTITTVMTFFVIRYAWKLPLPLCVAATGVFFAVDITFFAANAVKVLDGGWFPLLIGAACSADDDLEAGPPLLAERLRDESIELPTPSWSRSSSARRCACRARRCS